MVPSRAPDNSSADFQQPKAKLRFVILEHDSPRGRHWDLMLEQEGRLRTWALSQPPDAPGPIPAELLPDHRLDYLEYEGPISGGRGHVRRWDAGTYQILPNPDADSTRGKEIYLLEGLRLHGWAVLEPQTEAPGGWRFRWFPAELAGPSGEKPDAPAAE